MTELEDAWRSRALWSLAHFHLFENYEFCLDQVSLALAMRDLRTNVNHLDLAWNFPTNVPAAVLPDIVPQIVHYYGELTPQLTLKTIGLRQVDASIARFNSQIGKYLRRTLLK